MPAIIGRWRLGRDPPAASHADHDRAEVVDRKRDEPHRDALSPLEEAGEHEQRCAEDRRRREPKQRAPAVGIVATDDAGEDEMKHADEEVRNTEQHGVVSESARHRQGDTEQRRHRGEHRQPDATLVHIHRARQPRIDAPRPPERREHEHPAEDSTRRRVVREQDRDLSDREHEHQIEEKLERCDLVLIAALELALGVGHARTRPEPRLGPAEATGTRTVNMARSRASRRRRAALAPSGPPARGPLPRQCRRDGSNPGRSARLRPEHEVASGAAQYSRGVARGSVRGWFEADDLRHVLPFFSLAFALVAAITQPSSAADLVLTTVPVAAWSLWAFARNVPLAAVSVAIVVPVVVAQRSGELEPVMFNVSLLAFAAARWSPSLAVAVSLGVLAAATPVLVALVQDPMEVAVALWVVAIAFVWVVGRAVARQERLVVELERTRRQLAQQALLAERRRIARDVHDFVGHGLAAVMLQVTSARHVLRRDTDAAEEALRSAEEVGRRGMQELRRTVTLLRSDDEVGVAAPAPTASEIPALVDQARAGGLAVELHTRGDLSRIPPSVGLAVYRIAQEALANAARHAPRARTTIGLELAYGRVALVAETSGPLLGGPSSQRDRPHYGLIGMQERATALGGEFDAGPTSDGWRVHCELPVQDEGSL
jgi:signal transduction histidine kinase